MGIEARQSDRFFPMELPHFLGYKGCTLRSYLGPNLGIPVKDVNGVISSFIGASSSEHDDAIVKRIIGE